MTTHKDCLIFHFRTLPEAKIPPVFMFSQHFNGTDYKIKLTANKIYDKSFRKLKIEQTDFHDISKGVE